MNENDKKTVLLVDDEPGVLSSLRRLLRREGWEILTAGSAQEGLEMLADRPASLVLSDMRMPGMDGAEFLKHVKELYPDTVRLVLTGYSERDAVSRAFAEGDIHQMIAKPWDDEELKEILRDALRQSTSRENETPELRRIISRIGALPPLPGVYLRIRSALRNADESSAAHVAETISQDPAITAKILQIANSAFFGQRRQVESIRRAIVLLGLEMVGQLVLSAGIFQTFRGREIQGFSHDDFWRHSVGCGLAAQAIRKRQATDQKDLEQAALAGILHDLGKLVFAQHMPDQFARAVRTAQQDQRSISSVEKEMLGATHALAGGYLADWWSLPGPIVEAIRHHHDPGEDLSHPALVTSVHLADVLVNRLQIGTGGSGRVPDWDVAATHALRIGSEELESIELQVKNDIAESDM